MKFQLLAAIIEPEEGYVWFMTDFLPLASYEVSDIVEKQLDGRLLVTGNDYLIYQLKAGTIVGVESLRHGRGPLYTRVQAITTADYFDKLKQALHITSLVNGPKPLDDQLVKSWPLLRKMYPFHRKAK